MEAPTFGYSSDTYWVRFKLRNEGHLTNHWLLELVYVNLQYVDLYLPSPEGEGYIARQTGMLRPFSTRDIANHHIVFDIPLPFEAEQTFYMRFQSGSSMTLPLTLWLPETFFQASTQEQLFLGMFYGAFLIMLIYYLFLLYLLRESIYLYYTCFLASGILLFTSYDGITSQYLWPNWYTLNLYAVPVFFILFLASIIMFSDAFLEAGTRNPKLHRLDMLALAGWGICLLLVPFTSYHFIFNLIAPYGVVSLGLATVAGSISWQGGYRPARFFLLSWIGFIIGGILLLLVRLNFIPSTSFTEQLVRPGILWLMAFWAIALADRINLLKAEKEKANLEEQAIEAQYRKLVETMNDGLGMMDEDGRFTYVNDRFAEMLGFPSEELLGHLVEEFVVEENCRILADQLAKRKTGVTTPYELTWRRKDGSELFTVVSPMALFEKGSRYKGAFAVFTDITERVQASRLLEQRIAERTNELSTLLELSQKITTSEITTSGGLENLLSQILERLKLIVEYCSSAIFVFEKEKWSLKATWPVSSVKVDDLLLSSEETRQILEPFESGQPLLLKDLPDDTLQSDRWHALSTLLPPDLLAGAKCWFWVPILRQDRLIGLMMFGCLQPDGIPDEQVQVARAFANQAAVVIENNRLLEQAQAAAVAEDRNRLAQELHDSVTQTLFTASMLAQAAPRLLKEDQKVGLENIKKLDTLIRGALAEMRSLLIELRYGALRNQTLGQLLTTLAEGSRMRTNAAIPVLIQDDFTLPENVTFAFYRIAQEFLNNAINHARATQVKISLSEELGRTELNIRDNGCGFNPREIPEGHMGVNIMLERAAEIGGHLRIKSEPGLGTEVIVIWSDKGGSEGYERLEPIKVLVVDDHPVIRDGLKNIMLTYKDLAVIGEAENGDDALAFCQRNTPDVILMDVIMPGMGGMAVTRAVLERFPQVKVVMLTTYPDDQLVKNHSRPAQLDICSRTPTLIRIANAVAWLSCWAFQPCPRSNQNADPCETRPLKPGDDLSQRERDVVSTDCAGIE